VELDLEAKRWSGCPGATFRPSRVHMASTPLPYEDPGATYACLPVRWGSGTCLTATFSRNPQVRNGLGLRGPGKKPPAGATGLLTRNFRPKLFVARGLDDRRPVRLPRGLRRVTTRRGTAGHREVLVARVINSTGIGILPVVP